MIEKALIYATNSCGILVFDEPDFPEVPLQVPGGTVEEGEPVIDAARREFGDETGLVDRTGFRLLGDSHRTFERDGKLHNLHRTYFHLSLEDGLPDTWDHFDDHSRPSVERRFRLQSANCGLDAGRASVLVSRRYHLREAPGIMKPGALGLKPALNHRQRKLRCQS
ncbi:NUDIX domain-containing protein [Rhizobium laguerreae]|uniref:NUDIX domain-containing protein n=1 Tax=Rhizobium laguerreae TaxID=1076926 RepID=UPI00143F0920|nr:NUDIX domain-containing protein [Rhizobium laguerreae]NKM88712.1 NUDIX domain-containing protein [Rhizobium laguerreae]